MSQPAVSCSRSFRALDSDLHFRASPCEFLGEFVGRKRPIPGSCHARSHNEIGIQKLLILHFTSTARSWLIVSAPVQIERSMTAFRLDRKDLLKSRAEAMG